MARAEVLGVTLHERLALGVVSDTKPLQDLREKATALPEILVGMLEGKCVLAHGVQHHFLVTLQLAVHMLQGQACLADGSADEGPLGAQGRRSVDDCACVCGQRRQDELLIMPQLLQPRQPTP